MWMHTARVIITEMADSEAAKNLVVSSKMDTDLHRTKQENTCILIRRDYQSKANQEHRV